MSERKAAPRDFGFGENETMLRDLARRFLSERVPPETLRRLVAEAPEPIYEEGQRPRWDESIWKEIVDLGFEEEVVRKVVKMVDRNEYKRFQGSPILRISHRAFGIGRQMPLVAKYFH